MSEIEPGNNFHSGEMLVNFIEEHRPQLMAYIQRNLGPELRQRLEPEDILQEVTVAAVASLEQFNQPGRVPFKLLCQMCEQKIIDAHRRHFASQKRDASREAAIPDGSEAAGGKHTAHEGGNEEFGDDAHAMS